MNLDWANIYGTNFTFSILNKRKYYTIIGLISSIITFILMIIFVFLLGEDFLYRLNPQTIYSKDKPIDHRFFNISSKDLYIPWRINDKNGNPIEFTDKLYPFLYYEKYIKDPNTKEVIYTKETLNYTKCSSKNINITNLNITLEDYYCFNFNELTLGGSKDIDYYYQLTFALSFCSHGEVFTEETCSFDNLMELNTIFSSDNPWYFSFIYPEHNFEPNAKDAPLKVLYKIQSDQLNILTYKLSHFSFQYVQMIDDLGIFMPNKQDYSMLALYSTEHDFIISNQYVLNGSTSSVYQLRFSMSKDNDRYSRRYVQLPDFLANIGGLIRIIMLLFEMICSVMNDSFLYSSIVDYFFDFNQRSKPLRKDYHGHNNMNHLINTPVFGSGNNGNPNSITKQMLTVSTTPIINAFMNQSMKNSSQLSTIIQQKNYRKSASYGVSYAYMVKCVLFDSCMRKFRKYQPEMKAIIFQRALNFIRSRIDIIEYIRLINQSDIVVKELIKEKKYHHLFCFTKRINPFNKEEVNYVYKELYKFEGLEQRL